MLNHTFKIKTINVLKATIHALYNTLQKTSNNEFGTSSRTTIPLMT